MSKKTLWDRVRPLRDRVVVKPDTIEGEEKTKSGIIIPESASKEKPYEGEVVAVGEGRMDDGVLIKPDVKVGDKVIFSKYGYDEVEVDGIEYYILKGESILAVIK